MVYISIVGPSNPNSTTCCDRWCRDLAPRDSVQGRGGRCIRRVFRGWFGSRRASSLYGTDIPPYATSGHSAIASSSGDPAPRPAPISSEKHEDKSSGSPDEDEDDATAHPVQGPNESSSKTRTPFHSHRQIIEEGIEAFSF